MWTLISFFLLIKLKNRKKNYLFDTMGLFITFIGLILHKNFKVFQWYNSVLASSFFISQLPSLTDRVLKKVLIVFLLISQNPWFDTTAVISLTHRGMKHVDSVLSFLSSLLVAKHKINPVVQELWHVIWFQGLKKREQRFKPPLKT